jgi:hypothetical protein
LLFRMCFYVVDNAYGVRKRLTYSKHCILTCATLIVISKAVRNNYEMICPGWCLLTWNNFLILLLLVIKNISWLCGMAHTCNSSFLGVGDQEDCGLRQVWAKKTPSQQKTLGVVARAWHLSYDRGKKPHWLINQKTFLCQRIWVLNLFVS